MLSSIVEEMGETLVRAAYSTNVKERRDSATCLFDVQGRTLCQAMHIPMHLGSLMGVVEHTERLARAGIATIPSGTSTFEDRFDTDEIPDEKVFRTRIDVKGDEISARVAREVYRLTDDERA